jgi:hypothetical protein
LLDPLGLTVLYEPDKGPAADIVFVHGLGGSSQQTWSKNKDPALFWPREWLPLESGLSDVRISTFGYSAHLTSPVNAKTFLNISDFAIDLLFRLRFATTDGEKPLNIGKVPLIFVTHSMGGLVVKKAFILGQNDMTYQSLVRSISGIIFLSTPHRGTDLANVMNRILSACFSLSPKQYIAELQSNSQSLLEINEQFRHLAPKTEIVSFFETRKTSVGMSSVLILERDSSTLGYPGEISKHLDADHHGVCKFLSPRDPDYTSVRDILKYLVEKTRSSSTQEPSPMSSDEIATTIMFLGNPEVPSDDLEFFADKRLAGSCEWLVHESAFAKWFESTAENPVLLWCNGRPGSGKSVMSSYVVNTVQEQGLACSYYFFKSGAQNKNNLTTFLCSVASQIAIRIPEYRRRLLRLFEDSFIIEGAALRLLWQKLFLSTLTKTSLREPLFLIIDGLDEAENGPLLLKMLTDLVEARLALRIMVVSRSTPALTTAFDRLRKRFVCSQISLDNGQKDLQSYVVEEMEEMRGDETFKEHVIAQILEKADGNFLWVHLVVKEILQCHTEDSVSEALTQVPEDLGLLYERMDENLARISKSSEREMGRAILMWAACSRYSLSLQELQSALHPEHPGIIDMRHSIQRTCGEFVIIDNRSRITMMHASAREYLTTNPHLNYFIDPPKVHQLLFTKCMNNLMLSNTRGRSESLAPHPLLFYSTTSWPFHLAESAGWHDHDTLNTLFIFFRQQSVLSWIALLAEKALLRTLIKAAKVLTKFLKVSDHLDLTRSPLTHRIQQKEFLSRWAHDLVRVVAKFGPQLVKHPKAIFELVPAFCPPQSIMASQFASKQSPSTLNIRGSINSTWDDCLARFSLSEDSMPLEIKSLARYFAVVLADGTVKLFHSTTCEEARVFRHGERILKTCFSTAGERMATYGFLTTTVWGFQSSHETYSIKNPKQVRALAMTFDESDEKLITCSDDSAIRICDLADTHRGWNVLPDPVCVISGESDYGNSPRGAQFNHDGSLLAISYRGQHPSVWKISTSGPQFVSECAQRGNITGGKFRTQIMPTDAPKMCWNPITGHILGIYNDGCIFKWHPFEHEYELSTYRAAEIECSADGKFFVTAGSDGKLSDFDFAHFTPVYHLSYTMSVTSLAIDKSESRIYDIREQYCNVWEPNALLRLLETDEKASDALSENDGSTQASLSSEVSVEGAEPLTALSLNPANSAYAVGDDGGILVIYNADGDRQAELAERFMTIEHLNWSSDGQFVASADLSRVIHVDSLSSPHDKGRKVAAKPILAVNEKDTIRQLVLNSDGSYLLVAHKQHVKLWSVKSQSLSSTVPTLKSFKWYDMRSCEKTVVGFGTESVIRLAWDNATDLIELTYDIEGTDKQDIPSTSHNVSGRHRSRDHLMSPSDAEDQVEKVLVSPDERLALVQISRPVAHGNRAKDFKSVDISTLVCSPRDGKLRTKSLASPVTEELEVVFGFVDNNLYRKARRSSVRSPPISTSPESYFKPASAHVLVFLSKDFWICTYDVGEGRTAKIRKHFFLPRDWLNMDLLELACVTPDGRILCPRNGDVAIIENGLAEEWLE